MNLPEWAEKQQTRSEALVKSNAKLLEALNNSNHGVLPGLLPHAIGRALKSTRGRNAVYQQLLKRQIVPLSQATKLE